MTDERLTPWVGALSDRGRVRTANEDAFCVRTDAHLFAVADGMGGHQAGEVAAAMAVACVHTASVDPEDPERSLVAMFHEANRRILEAGRSRPELLGMGTTLTVAHVGPKEVTIAHVGDSRAYLIKQGRIWQVTQDHSVAGELVSTGQIDREQARRHPQRHVLTQALGTRDALGVQVVHHPREAADFLLLCTDGLTEVVSDEEILRMVDSGDDVEATARALVALADERGAPDNVTVLLIDLRAAPA